MTATASHPSVGLETLSASLRARLMAKAKLREYARGAVLAGGEAADGGGVGLRVVSSGLLALLANDPDPRPLALYGAGRIVVPIAPRVDGTHWTLSAFAVSNVHEIANEHLATLGDEPEFVRWRLSIAEADRQRTLDLLAAVGTPDAGERLVRLVHVAGTPLAEPNRLDWPLTQAQFAALAGLSRAHLNARLAALRDAGRLRIENRVAVL